MIAELSFRDCESKGSGTQKEWLILVKANTVHPLY